MTWNLEKLGGYYHGKMIWNLEIVGLQMINPPLTPLKEYKIYQITGIERKVPKFGV